MAWMTAAAMVGGNLLGGMMQGNSAKDAAETQANAQLQAAKIAAESSKFKPVGVTNRFGTSNFQYDPSGNLTQAGYTMDEGLRQQQDRLMGMAGNGLSQYEDAQYATLPMGDAALSMFGLGQQYLGTSPQEQAQKYYNDQQALLSTSSDRRLANLQNQMLAQGRTGLAVGATGQMGAANPELEAFYNAERQKDLALAAQATQGGMDYTKFGSGMIGSGGDMLKNMYGVQTAAYAPYAQALQGAQGLENLAQGAMDQGTAIGAHSSTMNAQGGQLLSQGMSNAAATQAQANAYNPWAGMLSGAGSGLQNYANQQQQQANFNTMMGVLQNPSQSYTSQPTNYYPTTMGTPTGMDLTMQSLGYKQ
jgi:hypothetical protein